MEENKKDIIDLKKIFAKLLSRKRTFVKVLCITFVCSVAWIIPEPRTYTSSVTLAPELSTLSGNSALGDLATSFGFDLGGMQTTDAIYPSLYPDIMESTTFVISLFDVHVKSSDGTVDTTYYHYLDKMQKSSFWKKPINWVKGQISKLTADNSAQPATTNKPGGKKYDDFFYSRRQDQIITSIKNKVKCEVDKKTDVITITVTDQDKLISATMADSVRARLQDYIIDYKTRKARVDVNYYANMEKKAKKDYELALARLSNYADAHFDMFLQSTQSRKAALENDVNIKLSVLNTASTQHQSALAKLQERTPSFTIIQPAVVPQKASGPKRMIFVAGMLILSMIVTALWIARKDIISSE